MRIPSIHRTWIAAPVVAVLIILAAAFMFDSPAGAAPWTQPGYLYRYFVWGAQRVISRGIKGPSSVALPDFVCGVFGKDHAYYGTRSFRNETVSSLNPDQAAKRRGGLTGREDRGGDPLGSQHRRTHPPPYHQRRRLAKRSHICYLRAGDLALL